LSKATHVNLKDYSEALANASLPNAILTGLIPSGATLNNANLSNANLVGVIGWDIVKGKDTIIGLDTAFNVPTG